MSKKILIPKQVTIFPRIFPVFVILVRCRTTPFIKPTTFLFKAMTTNKRALVVAKQSPVTFLGYNSHDPRFCDGAFPILSHINFRGAFLLLVLKAIGAVTKRSIGQLRSCVSLNEKNWHKEEEKNSNSNDCPWQQVQWHDWISSFQLDPFSGLGRGSSFIQTVIRFCRRYYNGTVSNRTG